MAYAQGATVFKTIMGNKRVHYGTFTQLNTETGGDIATGLRSVEYFELSGLVTTSVAGGTVTATTLDPGVGNQAGYWMAIGY